MIRTCAVVTTLALAATANAQLFGSEIVQGLLVTIDPATVTGMSVGPTGFMPLTGLAADSANNTLYAVNPGDGRIYKMDPSTGGSAPISAPLFTDNANGLAYRESTNTLYVAQLNTNSLHTYNLTTGIAALVGTFVGADNIEGLAYNNATGTLYGLSDGATEAVYKIDAASGATSLLATMKSPGIWRGLGMDPATGTLYASRVNPSLLTSIDPSTGAVTDLGAVAGIGSFVQGLAGMGKASCYADCDSSGSLDFFDFLCFQNEFAAGSSYADCDSSGSLDFFDFLCFQNEFAAGCP